MEHKGSSEFSSAWFGRNGPIAWLARSAQCLFLKTTSSIKCVSSDAMNSRWNPTQMISSFGVPIVTEKDPVLWWQPGWCSQYCDLLLTWWSGDQIPVGGENFRTIQNNPNAHSASCARDTSSLPRVKCLECGAGARLWMGWCYTSSFCACIGMSVGEICHYWYCNIVCLFLLWSAHNEVCHISMKNVHSNISCHTFMFTPCILNKKCLLYTNIRTNKWCKFILTLFRHVLVFIHHLQGVYKLFYLSKAMNCWNVKKQYSRVCVV